MAGESGVLLGQNKQDKDFFNSNNMYFFSVGTALAGKLFAVFGQANEIIANGGNCEITFKFNNGSLAGNVRYKNRTEVIKTTRTFTDIYELTEVVNTALYEVINAK